MVLVVGGGLNLEQSVAGHARWQRQRRRKNLLSHLEKSGVVACRVRDAAGLGDGHG